MESGFFRWWHAYSTKALLAGNRRPGHVQFTNQVRFTTIPTQPAVTPPIRLFHIGQGRLGTNVAPRRLHHLLRTAGLSDLLPVQTVP